MYELTHDAARDVFAEYDPDGLAAAVAAEPDAWARTVADRAVADPDDLPGRFAFLATVDVDDIAAADQTIFADGDHDDAARHYASYTDFVVWHVVRANARIAFADPAQVHALVG